MHIEELKNATNKARKVIYKLLKKDSEADQAAAYALVDVIKRLGFDVEYSLKNGADIAIKPSPLTHYHAILRMIEIFT